MPIRHAVVAGRFYPANPENLRREIAQSFQQVFPMESASSALGTSDAAVWSEDSPLLTMLPHAGYMFCGGVIAATLLGVKLPHRLVLLGPSHTGQGHPLGYWEEGAWETPLGKVPVNDGLGRELLALDAGFAPDSRPHLGDHSLEVLLPFLQTIQPDVSILPIVIASGQGLGEAGMALASLIKAHERDVQGPVSIVVSSDMNHFATDKENRRLDKLALDALLSLEPQHLADVVRQNRISMCGVMPAVVGLVAARQLGAGHARLMAYDTSASASGDAGRVVGYAGVRVW
jgi:AmmeMemoRadiSam system protein B